MKQVSLRDADFEAVCTLPRDNYSVGDWMIMTDGTTVWIRKSHSCNLCHANVSDGSGVGLVWGANREEIKLTTPGNAETHVCQDCITALETALEDQREHMRKRDEADAYEPA